MESGPTAAMQKKESTETLQKYLDENVRLIHQLLELQRTGGPNAHLTAESTRIQHSLHSNLIYLATLADQQQPPATHAHMPPAQPAATQQQPPQAQQQQPTMPPQQPPNPAMNQAMRPPMAPLSSAYPPPQQYMTANGSTAGHPNQLMMRMPVQQEVTSAPNPVVGGVGGQANPNVSAAPGPMVYPSPNQYPSQAYVPISIPNQPMGNSVSYVFPAPMPPTFTPAPSNVVTSSDAGNEATSTNVQWSNAPMQLPSQTDSISAASTATNGRSAPSPIFTNTNNPQFPVPHGQASYPQPPAAQFEPDKAVQCE